MTRMTRTRKVPKEESLSEGAKETETKQLFRLVSRSAQCKIRPLILKRFANQPRHCSAVKARDF